MGHREEGYERSHDTIVGGINYTMLKAYFGRRAEDSREYLESLKGEDAERLAQEERLNKMNFLIRLVHRALLIRYMPDLTERIAQEEQEMARLKELEESSAQIAYQK